MRTENDRPASEIERPAYEPPKITVMDEEEVLKTFQVTQAAITWWTM